MELASVQHIHMENVTIAVFSCAICLRRPCSLIWRFEPLRLRASNGIKVLSDVRYPHNVSTHDCNLLRRITSLIRAQTHYYKQKHYPPLLTPSESKWSTQQSSTQGDRYSASSGNERVVGLFSRQYAKGINHIDCRRKGHTINGEYTAFLDRFDEILKAGSLGKYNKNTTSHQSNAK